MLNFGSGKKLTKSSKACGCAEFMHLSGFYEKFEPVDLFCKLFLNCTIGGNNFG